MLETTIRSRFISLGLLLAMVFVVWWPEFSGAKFRPPTCDPDLLCVVFLDVGQGDSIFIQSPAGTQLLVDAGPDRSVLRELGRVLPFTDRELDYILLTHPDHDHIGGFTEVLARYHVQHIIRTEKESDTVSWQSLESAISAEGAEVTLARRGQRYDLGDGVFLEILFPDLDTTQLESNTASIVAQLSYGETTMLLTGDAPKAIEEYLVLITGENLQSDVLKVGHHGSRTSTAELFLEHVRPTFAVISSGAGNSYGHPHTEVTDLLFNYDVQTFNTADQGAITFYSDGVDFVVK